MWGLAPDGGVSVDLCFDCYTAIEGKPSPTLDLIAIVAMRWLLGRFWRGLAPDGGVSVNRCLDSYTAIEGKPSPTLSLLP